MKRTIITNQTTYEPYHWLHIDGEMIKVEVYNKPLWFGDSEFFYCIREEDTTISLVVKWKIHSTPGGYCDGWYEKKEGK